MGRIPGVCLLVLTFILSGWGIGVAEIHAASSSNSIQWYSASSQMVSNNLNDVVVNDRQIYVAVGDEGTILSSSDARTWRPANYAGREHLTTVVTNGRAFVAVGEKTMMSSTDGVNWSNGKWSKDYTFGELISPAYKKEKDKNYTIDWKTKLPFSSLRFSGVIWDGERFVALGYWSATAGKLKKNSKEKSSKAWLSGSFAITSADGRAWKLQSIDSQVGKLVFTGKQYVAMSFNRVYISTDLAEWKEYVPEAFKLRTAFTIKDLMYRNGMYIAVYWDPGISAQTGVIYTSRDGVNWKENTSGFKNRVLNTILWDGKQYWIGGAHGLLLRSDNVTDWEHWKDAVNNPWDDVDFAGQDAAINKMIYDGKRYVLVGNRGTIIISDKLMDAEIVRQRTAADLRYIDYDGSRYVAGGRMGSIVESRNGYDWQAANLDGFTYSYFHWTGIAVGDGIGIALGRVQDGLYAENEEYFYSPRPGVWERKKFPLQVRTPDGVEFRDGKFYVYDEGGYITSADGINWSKRVKLNPPMAKVVSNDSLRVGLTASTIDKTSTLRSGGDVYMSLDGSKWKNSKIVQNNKSLPFVGEDLVWNGKNFIAAGVTWLNPPNYEPAVFSSADGLSWSYKLTEARFESIACSKQACVAASESGDLYASNSDLSFKASPRPTQHRILKVLWDGDKFIALGKSGTILVSKKPVRAGNDTVEEQIVPFMIKFDQQAEDISRQLQEKEEASFRAEAEKRVEVVKRIGIEHEYSPFVEEKYNEWLCSLDSIEQIHYRIYKSGEYRNKLSFAVFFNGIDRRQLSTVGEIISEHTGASMGEVNTALKAIVDGAGNANGTTQVGNTLIQYKLALVQGEYYQYGELEVWY